MAHLVRAGITLIKQVDEHFGKEVGYTVGDLDGINRHRSIEFDAKTSKWLRSVLEAVDDPRIASLDDGAKSHLIVRFVGTVKADDPSPFALDEADGVLNPPTDN